MINWIACLFYPIFILLSRESDAYAIFGRQLAYELPISKFSGRFFDFFSVNLLLVRSHQAEIIIAKRIPPLSFSPPPPALTRTLALQSISYATV